jgi:hypothetical protein
MRPMLTEAFRETDYSISDHSYYEGRRQAEAGGDEEASNTVKTRIQPAWELLTKPMKKILTEKNYERLLTTTTTNLSNLLERRIWSYYGRVSEHGAVALERDIVDVANVAVKGENFKQREAFNRCLQIVTIMTLEDDEWEPIKSGSEEEVDAEWVLSSNERLRARMIVKGRE